MVVAHSTTALLLFLSLTVAAPLPSAEVAFSPPTNSSRSAGPPAPGSEELTNTALMLHSLGQHLPLPVSTKRSFSEIVHNLFARAPQLQGLPVVGDLAGGLPLVGDMLAPNKDPQKNVIKDKKKTNKPKDPKADSSKAPAEKAPASPAPADQKKGPLGIIKREAEPQLDVLKKLPIIGGLGLGKRGGLPFIGGLPIVGDLLGSLGKRSGPLDMVTNLLSLGSSKRNLSVEERGVPTADAALEKAEELSHLDSQLGETSEPVVEKDFQTKAEGVVKRDEINTDIGGHGQGSPSTSNGGLNAGSSFSNDSDGEDDNETEARKTKRDMSVESSPLLERHNAVLETLMWKRFTADDYQPGSSEIESLARSAAGNGNIDETLKKLASGGVWDEHIAEAAQSHAENAWEHWFSRHWGNAKRSLTKRMDIAKTLAPVTGLLGGVMRERRV